MLPKKVHLLTVLVGDDLGAREVVEALKSER
jgi:hypothetical protein